MAWESRRSKGKDKPMKDTSKKKCPKCGQMVRVYGVDIERHKVYANPKKRSGPYTFCPQKKIK